MQDMFKNKVVTFSTNENDIIGILNPEFQIIKDKILVVGTVPKGSTTNDWAIDKVCAVSWIHVTDYMIFDSIEDYNTSINKS